MFYIEGGGRTEFFFRTDTGRMDGRKDGWKEGHTEVHIEVVPT